MNQIIKNTVKVLVATIVVAFVLVLATFFNSQKVEAWSDAYVTSYTYESSSRTCYWNPSGCGVCFWPNVWNENRNFTVCGGCPGGSHWHAHQYINSCTGASGCDNGYFNLNPYTETEYATDYICHYISSVNSWSVCANGMQVATSVNWSSVAGTSCSNVPLTQRCGPTVDIKANGSDGPIIIDRDTSATISWTSSDATACTVSNSLPPDPDWTTLSDSQPSGSLINTTTYVQSCTGFGGTDSDSVSICINPQCNNPENSCSIPANRCLSGTSTTVMESPAPTVPDSSVGSFTWKCQDTCNGVSREVSCSSERSNPLVAEGAPSESIWSDCNLSCGGGSETRTISYHNCYKKTETQACNSQPCPPGYKEVAPW
ncbi:MAG: hypothetical protein V1690_02925 [Candidatus Moraniibacteriota bacterium]